MIVLPGPPPKKHARRRNARPDWVTLPAEGRRGFTPEWPLPGRTPRGWVGLWRLPQAVMWERNSSHVQVASYLVTRNRAHDLLLAGEPNAALLAELRQMEDRLGLSPMAMRRLQWEVEEPRAVSSSGDGKVIEANDRFRSL